MKIKGAFAKTYDRFVKRQTLLPDGFLELVKSTGAKDILEFGCGTGTVAIGLGLEGFTVTGVDYSPGMLEAARRKARTHRAAVRFIQADIAEVRIPRTFDLLICLGNTIPHFTSRTALSRLLRNCVRHLRPNGHVIFQLLNYDRILKDRPATIAVDVAGEMIRFRQYRYQRHLVDFVVSIVDVSHVPPALVTTVVRIAPWTRAQIRDAMQKAGFGRISTFGDYARRKFTLKSKDLIVIARKKASP